MRGKKNEPSFINILLEKLAILKNNSKEIDITQIILIIIF